METTDKVAAVLDQVSDGLPEAIRGEWSLTCDPHDAWGDNLSWWFAVNEVLTAMGEPTNDEYHPSPYVRTPTLTDIIVSDDYVAPILAELVLGGLATATDLHTADKVFEAADHAFRLLGLEY
jgi:hypothetical protein